VNANESNERAKPNTSPCSAPHLTLHFLDFRNFDGDLVRVVAFKLSHLRKSGYSAPTLPLHLRGFLLARLQRLHTRLFRNHSGRAAFLDRWGFAF